MESILGAACCLGEDKDEIRDDPGTRVEDTETSLSDTNLADHEGVGVAGSAAEGYKEGRDLVVNLAGE